MLKVVARLTVKKDKIDDPQKFAFIECWKDGDALKTHEATDHFRNTFPVLGAMTEGSEPVEIYSEVEF